MWLNKSGCHRYSLFRIDWSIYVNIFLLIAFLPTNECGLKNVLKMIGFYPRDSLIQEKVPGIVPPSAQRLQRLSTTPLGTAAGGANIIRPSTRTTGGPRHHTVGPSSSAGPAGRPPIKRLSTLSTPPNVCGCHRQVPLATMDKLGTADELFVSSEPFTSGSQGSIYHGYSAKMRKCVALKLIFYGKDYQVNTGQQNQQQLDPQYQMVIRSNDLELKEMATQEIECLYFLQKRGVKSVVTLMRHYLYPNFAMFILVMEMGEHSLKDYWQKFTGRRPSDQERIEKIKSLLGQILKAFIEIHDAGILHMDFKMANAIMVKEPHLDGTQKSRLKLIDFAGAQHTQATNQPDRFIKPTFIVGSPGYLSPEQKLTHYYNQLVSAKSDIWAIGCVLMEMLLDQTPNTLFWYANNRAEIRSMMQTMEGNIKTAMNRWSREKLILWSPLLQLAKSCLHDDPALRPQAYQMMAYLYGRCKMPISSVYGGIARAYDGYGQYKLNTGQMVEYPICTLLTYQQYGQLMIGNRV